MSTRERWDQYLASLGERYGPNRVSMLFVLVIAALASLVIQLLGRFNLDRSALLYLAVPYTVALMITLARPYTRPDTWWKEYVSHSLTALVVFLASSVVLFEGFICVLFFMPIYFLVVTLVFIGHWIVLKTSSRGTKTYAHGLPILVALLSLEGATGMTTIDRHNTATASVTTSASVETILQNLAGPIDIPASNNWMLAAFPMPVDIEAGSLNAGDVHRIQLRYHRWFFTNTHEGEIALRIDSVASDRVTATFIKDTSYFSTYVRLIGSDLRIAADAAGQTRIEFSIRYERRLDPAWYFQPMQQYAMQGMARHFIEEVMIRE